MIETMKQILVENDICVLATSADNEPYCSLMSYIADDEGRHVYMLTQSRSRKYGNLMKNPRASLLIDTRSRPGAGHDRIQALTVTVTLLPCIKRDAAEHYRRCLFERLPPLQDLAEDQDARLIGFRVEAVLLLNGPLEAHYQEWN